MALVSQNDLQAYLKRSLSFESAAIAIRVAEGWLRSATRLTVWPNPVDAELFSWTIELAAIAWSNPEGLESLTVSSVSRTWAVTRRNEILTAAASRYPSSTAGPQHSFPPVHAFPRSWGDPR